MTRSTSEMRRRKMPANPLPKPPRTGRRRPGSAGERRSNELRRGLRKRSVWRAVMVLVMSAVAISSVVSQWWAPIPARKFDKSRVPVVRIVDGDTIIVRTDDKQERVRLRGIDAPELAHDGQPAAYWGDRATDYLNHRLSGRDVTLQVDPLEPRDRFGRVLAFVYLTESDCINLDLVRDGQAYADRRFDSHMKSQIIQAEAAARKKSVGLWKGVKEGDMPSWRQRWLNNTNR